MNGRGQLIGWISGLLFGCAHALCAQDSTATWYLRSVEFVGNKKTKESILRRELVVDAPARLDSVQCLAQLERSRQNLMNLSLFNFVEPRITRHADTVDVVFQLTERWYIWPSPVFEYVDPNFNTWWETRDFTRTNIGLLLTQYNSRGRNEVLRLRAKIGYNKQVGLSYSFPYINKAKTLGLTLYADYVENYQVNTGSAENKRIFYTRVGEVVRREHSVSTRLQYRPKLNGTHYFFTKWIKGAIQDSLASVFADYFGQGRSTRSFVELGYSYVYDKTDYRAYPLKGIHFTGSVFKPDIYLDRGSKSSVWQAYAQWRQYLPVGKKTYFAYSAALKATRFNDLPYSLQRGLGYADYVRGYEYYIFDAQQYAILKTSTKIRLLDQWEIKLPFIRNTKFNRLFVASYANANFDVGYAADRLYAQQNPLSNNLLLGGGLGLDVISFYDFVIRVEYSFNRIGQQGFFMHFSRPI